MPALDISVSRHKLRCELNVLILCIYSLDLHHTQRSNANLAQKYFSQLDVETFEALAEMYKVDLEMFEYSSQDYYQYVVWLLSPVDLLVNSIIKYKKII